MSGHQQTKFLLMAFYFISVAVTVAGTCGIAFAPRFMHVLSQEGIEFGFYSEMSQLITTLTVKGAAIHLILHCFRSSESAR